MASPGKGAAQGMESGTRSRLDLRGRRHRLHRPGGGWRQGLPDKEARKDTEYLIALDGKGEETVVQGHRAGLRLEGQPVEPRAQRHAPRWPATGSSPWAARVSWSHVKKAGMAPSPGGRTAEGPRSPSGATKSITARCRNQKMHGLGLLLVAADRWRQANIVRRAPGAVRGPRHQTSGKVLWQKQGGPDPATYSSPVLSDGWRSAQVRSGLVQDGAVGVAAKDGELLWRYKRASRYPDVFARRRSAKGDFVYHLGRLQRRQRSAQVESRTARSSRPRIVYRAPSSGTSKAEWC